MKYFVFKIGGSLVSPRDGDLNINFLKNLSKSIKDIYSDPQNSDVKIVIVVGGGSISRKYRDALISIGEMDDVDQHRIGIVSTWMNAELVRLVLGVELPVYQKTLGIGVFADSLEVGLTGVMDDFSDWKNSDKPILVSGGFVNGASTDLNAFVLASKLEIDSVYKMSNVDYLYSDDPVKNPDAKIIKDTSWDQYFAMFDDVHKPGQNLPVDILGARLAKDNNLKLYLMKGDGQVSIGDIISGKSIEGSIIH